MSKLTILVGFPGSGKSYYINNIKEEYNGKVADDFMKDSKDNSREFLRSCHWEELVADLNDDRDCLISDIRFCNEEDRNNFESQLKKSVDNVVLDWQYFENNPDVCIRNVLSRQSQQKYKQIQYIICNRIKYQIPENSEIIPVYSSNVECERQEESFLYTHRFVIRLFNTIKPVVEVGLKDLMVHLKKTGKMRIKKGEGKELDIADYYSYEVFRQICVLIENITNVNYSLTLIRMVENRKILDQIGISRLFWLKYNYSSMLINMSTIYDLCLILINKVYRLGNREKNCNEKAVLENEHVKDDECINIMSSIKRILNKYKEKRNLIVHQGEYRLDEMLDNFSFILFGEDIENKAHRSNNQQHKIVINDDLCKGVINLTMLKTQIEIDKIEILISKLFNELEKIYDKRKPASKGINIEAIRKALNGEEIKI